jgi:Phage integrase family
MSAKADAERPPSDPREAPFFDLFAAAERTALARILPRRNRWADLLAFDERIADIEQQQARLNQELGELFEQQRTAGPDHERELLAVRWDDIDLLEGVLRVRDSKSEDGIRSIAFSTRLADELREHWRGSAYQGDDELVFCDPLSGRPYRAERFGERFREALKAAGIEGYVRPFHDLRHTAITNDAASGANAIAVMTKAGHADMKTTRRYMHLAGVTFRDEADRLEARLLGTAVESSTDLSESQPT